MAEQWSSKPPVVGSTPSFPVYFTNLKTFFSEMLGISSTLFVQIIGAFRCGTCLLVIGVQNPIHSILLLIRVFFLGTLLLFFLQREYYARLFLIVYVGAIVVLFLFIIRRLELKRVNVYPSNHALVRRHR